MINKLVSKYDDICFIKIENTDKVSELFELSDINIGYDYFNYYINNNNSNFEVFYILNESINIGIISLYNIDTINNCANIFGFVTNDIYTSYLIKSIISIMNHAFLELNLNKLKFLYKEENYYFDSILISLEFINEGILRDQLFYKNKYHNISVYSILRYEFNRLIDDDYKRL